VPRIFDNIDLPLLPALQQTLQVSERADFCVDSTMRVWKAFAAQVNAWVVGERFIPFGSKPTVVK